MVLNFCVDQEYQKSYDRLEHLYQYSEVSLNEKEMNSLHWFDWVKIAF